MCVNGERGHETVISDSILLVKKDPAVLPSHAHRRSDEEDSDVRAQVQAVSNHNPISYLHPRVITALSVSVEENKNKKNTHTQDHMF